MTSGCTRTGPKIHRQGSVNPTGATWPPAVSPQTSAAVFAPALLGCSLVRFHCRWTVRRCAIASSLFDSPGPVCSAPSPPRRLSSLRALSPSRPLTSTNTNSQKFCLQFAYIRRHKPVKFSVLADHHGARHSFFLPLQATAPLPLNLFWLHPILRGSET